MTEQTYKRTAVPRYRLTHLLAYMRKGQQGEIAALLRCHPATISAVLNGRQSQNSDLARNIIRLAEECVRRNNPYRYRQIQSL